MTVKPRSSLLVLTGLGGLLAGNFAASQTISRLVEAENTRIEQAQAQHLAYLNETFTDLLEKGGIEVIDPLPPEVRDNDYLDHKRVALFPKHSYGRIRQLIAEDHAYLLRRTGHRTEHIEQIEAVL